MNRRVSRTAVASVLLTGAIAMWSVSLSPQTPGPPSFAEQIERELRRDLAVASAEAGSQPPAPMPEGRGGRGGFGGRGVQPSAAAGAAPAGMPPGDVGSGAQAAPPVFTPPPAAYPRRFKVEVSMDGKTWSAPVAEGEGSGASTVIAFPPVRARFVRITQTAEIGGASSWSIQRLRLFGVAETN